MGSNNYIITVQQQSCLESRLYKLVLSGDSFPTIRDLIELGADINEYRKDEVAVETVSDNLFNAIHAKWLAA